MRYKAVVFDLDGTLLYTLDDLHLACNHALEASGMPPRARDEVRRFVGNGYRQLIRLAVPDGTPDRVQEQVLRRFNAFYLEHDQDHTAPYPGIKSMLSHLAAHDVQMAVVSNKGDAAVADLMAHYFPGTFRAVAGEREGIRRKPAPDTVLAVMGLLGVRANETAYVGDSEVDILTAANVGCDHIAVTWGYRDRAYLAEQGAHNLADTCDELEQLLA